MNNWTARDYVIALILFSGVIALVYLMAGSVATDYGTPGIVNEKFSENYNKLTENTQMVNDALSATRGTGGLNILGVAEILISSTFSVANLIFSSLDNIRDQVFNIGVDFGVPTQVTGIILAIFVAIIIISIVFIILNALNKTDKL